jgi:predicted lipid-binding transport protein (Tim44 family)
MDIIFFAAIALFIFFKLKGQFGKVDEDQRREAIKKFLKEKSNTSTSKKNKEEENLDEKTSSAESINKNTKTTNKDNKILEKLSIAVQNDLKKVLEKSKVSITDFVNGSGKAFEIIIESFSKSDKKPLKNLLSEDLFTKFSQAIDDRIEAKKTLHTDIVAIDESDIKSAKIDNNNIALISVNFTSKQIIYTTDDNNEVIDGSKERIHEVSDLWTFSRDVNSKNPNWVVISTKS